MSTLLTFKSYDKVDLELGSIVYNVFVDNVNKRYYLRQHKIIQLTSMPGYVVIESTQDKQRSVVQSDKLHTNPIELCNEWIKMIESDINIAKERLNFLKSSLALYTDQKEVI